MNKNISNQQILIRKLIIEELGKKYTYKGFKFESEDGQIIMTHPDEYEGEYMISDTPTIKEIQTTIADFYDIQNRKIPIDIDEIKFLNKNLTAEEQEIIIGFDFTGNNEKIVNRKIELINKHYIGQQKISIFNNQNLKNSMN